MGLTVITQCLYTHLEEVVFLHAKGSNLEGDVIGDDDNIPTLGVLWGEESELPGNHTNLNKIDNI